MRQPVSRGQVSEVVARVANQTHWSAIDGDRLQKELISLSPQEFGDRITLFLDHSGSMDRLMVNQERSPVIRLATPADLSKFMKEEKRLWGIWRGSRHGSGLFGFRANYEPADLKVLDISKMLFETCVEGKETHINGETKLDRLRRSSKILLGGRCFLALWEDCLYNKGNSILEWLRRNKEVVYLDFFGLILREKFPLGQKRKRAVLTLRYGALHHPNGNYQGWEERIQWIDSGSSFTSYDTSATLANVSKLTLDRV